MTPEERSQLLFRMVEMEKVLYPEVEPVPTLTRSARAQVLDAYYLAIAEYFDRLPRVVLSACPFTGTPLKRVFDPLGLDGPFWPKVQVAEVVQPDAPATFRVLLGALDLHGRPVPEVTEEILPGPDAPFVVPRLLKLPGMVAVISRVELSGGDVAYPIGYFSETEIPAHLLHQFWLKQELWFDNSTGSKSWMTANDTWDFDLAPYVAAGKVRWIRPGDTGAEVVGSESGEACPYVGLPGQHRPQVLSGGELDLLDLPTGESINPFED